MAREKIKSVSVCLLGIWLCLSYGCDSVTPEDTNFFIKYYGEDDQQEGVDLLVNSTDQSLLLLGTTYEESSAIKKVYLVKTNWNGDIIWSKTLGGPDDKAKDIEISSDGGYVILAETVNLNGNADIKIIKINESGEEVTSAVYSSPAQNNVLPNDYPVSLTAMSDGYIITGTTEYNTGWANTGSVNSTDALHLRLDLRLNVYDTGEFYIATGESENDGGIKTVKLRDDRYYLFGTSQVSYDGPVNDDFNFWYFGMNNGGIQNGRKGIIGQDLAGRDERLYAVCPTFSNGFFLVGTYSGNSIKNDLYVAQLYEDGGELNKAEGERNLTIYKGSETRDIVPVAVCQSYFNRMGYLIVGNEGEEGAKNIWLSKVDDTGVLLWSASFGSNSTRNDDLAGAVAELPDGRIVVLGTVNLNVTNIKMALFKLNGHGELAN